MLKETKALAITDSASRTDLEYGLPTPEDHLMIDCNLLACNLFEYGRDGKYGMGAMGQKAGLNMQCKSKSCRSRVCQFQQKKLFNNH